MRIGEESPGAVAQGFQLVKKGKEELASTYSPSAPQKATLYTEVK